MKHIMYKIPKSSLISVRQQIRPQLYILTSSQVATDAGNQVYVQVRDQIGGQAQVRLRESILDQIGNNLWSNSEDQL